MTSRLTLRKKKRSLNEEIEQSGKPGQSVSGNEINAVMSGNATLDMMAKSKQIQNKKIFQRAILNANIHGISLVPGRENQGDGNCSYESVIFNINDRSCFAENLSMSPDYYRRIWNIDMMNKIIEKENPWNPGLSKEQIRGGFTELMESGIYERPFFGDMMLAGIACGIRKRILIFNSRLWGMY